MKQLAIVHNPKSGGDDGSKTEIEQAFEQYDVQLQFITISDSLAKDLTAAKQAGASIFVAAGGDGTVNAVAQSAVEHGMPLGVLGVGTLNHFAKDANLPLDINEAARIIASGKTTKVDYCTINDEVFVNNASIGLYPITVLKRDDLMPKLGKWPAAILAALAAVVKVSTTHLEFTSGDDCRRYKTPLAFIGNNSYEFNKLGFTNRNTISDGKLFLYVVRANRSIALLRLSILAFFGKHIKGHDYLAETSQQISIGSRKKVLDVAIDGEVVALKPPLICNIHPCGLTICSE
jgi:diacylglycerol kinase family enzyme